MLRLGRRITGMLLRVCAIIRRWHHAVCTIHGVSHLMLRSRSGRRRSRSWCGSNRLSFERAHGRLREGVVHGSGVSVLDEVGRRRGID